MKTRIIVIGLYRIQRQRSDLGKGHIGHGWGWSVFWPGWSTGSYKKKENDFVHLKIVFLLYT